MKISIPCLLAASAFLIPSQSDAAATFLFVNNSEFDGFGVGTSMTTTDVDNSIDITVTTVDVLFRQYFGDLTPGNIRSVSSFGIGGTTIASGSSGEAIGLDNPTVDDTEWDTIGGDGNEETDMNHDESWIVSFNVDVFIDILDMESMSAGDSIIISVDDGVTSDVILGDSGGADSFTDPLSGLLIAAGTEVTFTASGDVSTDIRMESFTITGVPEPGAAILASLSLLSFVGIRRR